MDLNERTRPITFETRVFPNDHQCAMVRRRANALMQMREYLLKLDPKNPSQTLLAGSVKEIMPSMKASIPDLDLLNDWQINCHRKYMMDQIQDARRGGYLNKATIDRWSKIYLKGYSLGNEFHLLPDGMIELPGLGPMEATQIPALQKLQTEKIQEVAIYKRGNDKWMVKIIYIGTPTSLAEPSIMSKPIAAYGMSILLSMEHGIGYFNPEFGYEPMWNAGKNPFIDDPKIKELALKSVTTKVAMTRKISKVGAAKGFEEGKVPSEVYREMTNKPSIVKLRDKHNKAVQAYVDARKALIRQSLNEHILYGDEIPAFIIMNSNFVYSGMRQQNPQFEVCFFDYVLERIKAISDIYRIPLLRVRPTYPIYSVCSKCHKLKRGDDNLPAVEPAENFYCPVCGGEIPYLANAADNLYRQGDYRYESGLSAASGRRDLYYEFLINNAAEYRAKRQRAAEEKAKWRDAHDRRVAKYHPEKVFVEDDYPADEDMADVSRFVVDGDDVESVKYDD